MVHQTNGGLLLIVLVNRNRRRTPVGSKFQFAPVCPPKGGPRVPRSAAERTRRLIPGRAPAGAGSRRYEPVGTSAFFPSRMAAYVHALSPDLERCPPLAACHRRNIHQMRPADMAAQLQGSSWPPLRRPSSPSWRSACRSCGSSTRGRAVADSGRATAVVASQPTRRRGERAGCRARPNAKPANLDFDRGSRRQRRRADVVQGQGDPVELLGNVVRAGKAEIPGFVELQAVQEGSRGHRLRRGRHRGEGALVPRVQDELPGAARPRSRGCRTRSARSGASRVVPDLEGRQGLQAAHGHRARRNLRKRSRRCCSWYDPRSSM